MGFLNQIISTIALNVNNLNSPSKGSNCQVVFGKQALATCYLLEIHFKYTSSLKENELKRVYSVNTAHKNTGVPILISDKIDFIIRNITRYREKHFIMIKEPVHQEDITIDKTSR